MKARKPARKPRNRDYIDIGVVVWDDAHMNTSQGKARSFGNGLKVITAGIWLSPGRKSKNYISVAADYMPELDEIRTFHNIPRGIVKLVRKVRVYL